VAYYTTRFAFVFIVIEHPQTKPALDMNEHMRKQKTHCNTSKGYYKSRHFYLFKDFYQMFLFRQMNTIGIRK